MVIKRKFELFCDDATGDYGVAINNSSEHQFNAFWNGVGIFHDCFEHYFEDMLPPFIGNNAYTVWGEVAAMGAALQYVKEKGVRNRSVSNTWSITDSIFGTVFDMFEDAEYNKKEYGYLESMGFPLVKCPVKYQRPNDVDYNWQDSAGNSFRRINCPTKYKQDIKNTMRWGAKLANKLWFYEMSDIITSLNNFCKNLNASELFDMGYKQIDFKFNVVNHNLRSAKVKFYGYSDTKWLDITNPIFIDDLYIR